MGVPQELQAARLRLVLDKPYIATALWQLIPIETPDMAKNMPGPIGVDQWWHLYYDPALLAKTSTKELAAILYHEINHLLRNHHERNAHETEQGNGLIANLAADCEINDDIPDIPEWAVKPSSFGFPPNLLNEEYLELLKKNAKKVKVQVNIGAGKCGSCATGEKGAAGEQPPDKDGKGSGPGIHGIGKAEAELIRRAVAEAVRQAAAEGRGDIPGSLARWADVLLHPVVDWKKELASSIRQTLSYVAGRVDFTYKRRARRQSVMSHFVLPGMQAPAPQVAVVVDTSGSIDDDQLKAALAEIDGIIKATGHNHVGFVCVDAAIHFAGNVRDVRQVKKRLKGGGGTDMRLGITAALELKPRPHLVVLLTDGLTPWPSQPLQKARLIVVLSQKDVAGVPTWAKTITIV